MNASFDPGQDPLYREVLDAIERSDATPEERANMRAFAPRWYEERMRAEEEEAAWRRDMSPELRDWLEKCHAASTPTPPQIRREVIELLSRARKDPAT